MADDRAAEHPTPSRRPPWPAALAGMLALVIVAELAIARIAREIQGQIYADWRGRRLAASSKDAIEADILCFGDSLVKNGIVPASIEARLDRKAYNLAALNGPTPASYSLLGRALDAGARPRAIVIDCSEGQLWGSNYRFDVAGWADLIDPLEAWQMARVERDPGFFGLYLIHRLLPSSRLRLDVRREMLDRLAAAPAGRYVPWRTILERQSRRNGGAFLIPSAYSKQSADRFPGGELSGGERDVWYRSGPFAKPTNLVYLDLFLRLTQTRKIPVFFLVPPIHPGVLARREGLGLEGEYRWFVRTIHDRYPNVVVVDGRHSGYGHAQFLDTCHLHIDGATSFSDSVAEVIARKLDDPSNGPRWVTLPRYAEPTARLAVEALDESMAVADYQRRFR